MSEQQLDTVKAKELVQLDRRSREVACIREIQEAINALCAKYRCRVEIVTTIRGGEISQQLATISID